MMGRRLYSEGFYGGLKRDRRAERARDGISPIPGRSVITVLAVLALILVIASVVSH